MLEKEQQQGGDIMKEKIKPELASGFRDYLPQEMIARQEMLDKIREVFERFGFDPLDTPVVERLDVLTGKSPDFKMNLFRTGVVSGLREPNTLSFREMALRFDLTVPLARVVASNLDLPKPFKRYQVGYVFRGEKAQKGRFRGFLQFDADIVGVSSVLGDTEIIWLMVETMRELGIKNFVVRINNRKILEGLAEGVGFARPLERKREVFRILDKLEKIGWDEVAKELARSPENETDLSAPNVPPKGVDAIKRFLDISGAPEEVFSQLKDLFKGKTQIGLEGVRELEEITEYLQVLGLPQNNWRIDLSIARGLDYYTGPVFETTLTDLPQIGSVFSGGRYDGLVSVFSDARLPATGASIGVDRLFVALKELGLLKEQSTITQVLIALFDPNLISDYLKLAKSLRETGIRTEVYLGEEPFKAQLSYALKKGIPVILILGPDEKKKGVVAVKDLQKRTQEEVIQGKLGLYLKNLLN